MLMETTVPTDVRTVDARNDKKSNPKPSAQEMVKLVMRSSDEYHAQFSLLRDEAKALSREAGEAFAELARPTPGMLRAMNGLIKAMTAVTREYCSYVSSARAAMPVIRQALSESRDRVGAYTVEELSSVK